MKEKNSKENVWKEMFQEKRDSKECGRQQVQQYSSTYICYHKSNSVFMYSISSTPVAESTVFLNMYLQGAVHKSAVLETMDVDKSSTVAVECLTYKDELLKF